MLGYQKVSKGVKGCQKNKNIIEPKFYYTLYYSVIGS